MPGLPTRFWEYVSRSTLKREAASLLMIWWASLFTVITLKLPIEQAIIAVTGVQLLVFGVFTAAFGSDWLSKQTTVLGPPQGPESAGLKVEVAPQDVKVDGVLKGTINVDQEGEGPKNNG